MVEKNHRSSGLLGSGTRKTGNFKPTKSYKEDSQTSVVEEQIKSTQVIGPKEAMKRSFKYQKRSIKISEDQGLVLDAIGRVNNMKFNYEIIQLLIDTYRDNASENDRRRIDGFLDISK